MMNAVQTIAPEAGLTPALGASVYALANAIWPPAPGATVPTLGETRSQWRAQRSAHFVITSDADGETVFAHALIFPRTVLTDRGPLMVGALATVCVHPDYRGRGWGADVVRAAFDYLPRLGAEVALFQTGVPSFYERLGGRIVTANRFVNGSDPNNPFWDACAMVHPAAFPFPDGEIDLNGAGY